MKSLDEGGEVEEDEYDDDYSKSLFSSEKLVTLACAVSILTPKAKV